jgi:hypothetical protein
MVIVYGTAVAICIVIVAVIVCVVVFAGMDAAI